MSGLTIERVEGALAGPAALRIAAAVRAAVGARGFCALALAGGSTPRGVYERLAQEHDLPWNHVLLIFSDERCVPPDDPRSNFRMVRESLLTPLGGRAPLVLRMEGEDPSPRAAAVRYEAGLRKFFGGNLRATGPGDPVRIDLALLGLGTDGHTASLFPAQASVAASEADDGRLVTAVAARPDGLGAITLTHTALRQARQRLFLVAGEAKEEIVAEITRPGCGLPAASVGPAVILFAEE